MTIYRVAIVEDHLLLSQAIGSLVSSFDNFEVSSISNNGEEFLNLLMTHKELPDIVLMDVNMPILNGIETTAKLKQSYPNMKVLALSVDESDQIIIKMLRAGARGYLLKDVEKDVLKKALLEVIEFGYYHTAHVSNILVNALTKDKKPALKLKDRELEFLKHACTELTYREIAEKMFLSPKTIDNYRDTLFQKMNVKNRVGLVLYAIKHNFVTIE
jgi:DNA-binding NarL/FixJ family response regulator